MGVTLTPNPAQDFVNVDIADNAEGTWYTISIVAPNGRVMRCVNTQERRYSIPVAILHKGTYVMVIATGDGRYHSQVFVKR
ncbi:MAG: T9SS type A sorting domain-containing protein [Bacteroidales bacterium]|nr:T9SS type A sorting domain-containing protein [Bacteroidales bacterium]